MKYYNAKDIRNVALAGHAGRGKTSLAEAMLYIAGLTDRLGRVEEGNTALDFDPERSAATFPLRLHLLPLNGKTASLI